MTTEKQKIRYKIEINFSHLREQQEMLNISINDELAKELTLSELKETNKDIRKAYLNQQYELY